MVTEIFKRFPLNEAVKVGNLGTIIRPNGRLATKNPDNVGYLRISIAIDGVLVQFKQHQVIAMVWVENPDNLPEVNHKDGNKLNCAADNLEWSTHADNIAHGRALGLWTKKGGRPKGYKHSKATKAAMRRAKLGKTREGFRGAWID